MEPRNARANKTRDSRSAMLVESRFMADMLGFRALSRRIVLPAVVALTASPAGATRHLTVEQLEKTLAASVAKHRADADLMKEFGDFDLSERLTDATRNKIATELHLGPQATFALQLLADESAVLDPPAVELPKDAAPDAAEQKHMLEIATGYVKQTLPHLPDFLATRTTYTFNDTPQIFKVNEWPVRAGLHLISKSSGEVTYRDDHVVQTSAPVKGTSPQAEKAKEVQASGAGAAPPVVRAVTSTQNTAADAITAAVPTRAPGMERGLQSFGEFGPLLGIVFVDTQKRTPTFHHWEQTPAGLVAVYHYSVPKADSHYVVNYCCEDDNLRTNSRGGGGGRRGGGRGAAGSVATGDQIPLHLVPGYHGSLFVDPADRDRAAA